MKIVNASDINSLYSINSNAIRDTLHSTSEETAGAERANVFDTFLNAAVSNITDTNEALSNEENEILKWSMGISENTHDLTIAVGKAETALNYTIALRDKLLEAYKEIMQIQI